VWRKLVVQGTLHRKGAVVQRRVEDVIDAADALFRAGCLAMTLDDHPRAAMLFEESLALCRSVEELDGADRAALDRAAMAIGGGDLDGAWASIGETLAVFREMGSNTRIGLTAAQLLAAGREECSYDRALIPCWESLRQRWELSVRQEVLECLERLVRLACAQGHGPRAARLHGAASVLRSTIKHSLTPAERLRYERDMAVVRDRLGSDAFAAAEAEGRTLPLDELAIYCLAGDREDMPGQRPGTP
jgi:hypothetical protein